MLRKTFRIDELQCCSDVEVLVCKAVKNVQVLEAEKKSAWIDLDRVDFENFLQRVNVQIEKSAWTGLGKVKKGAFSAASVFNFSSGLVTRGSPKRSALRWLALDKRCSSCYTLRGCGFADIQSREEFTDALAS